jgi:hypothetical protein
VMFQKEDNTSMRVNIEQNEIDMIKKVFLNKIERVYKAKNNKEIRGIILQFDMADESLKIFIEDINKDVNIFDY